MGEVFGTGASDTEARGVVMASETAARAYHVVDFAEVPGVPCPCGASDSSGARNNDLPGQALS